MSKPPIATSVQNLRRIWEIKRREMDITQVEAAAKLNWTQGAFSQYLNDITEMSPLTIIKLANFLDVNPAEIDPEIDKSLPNVSSYEARYNISSPNTKISKMYNWSNNLGSEAFLITIDKTVELVVNKDSKWLWKLFAGEKLTVIDCFAPGFEASYTPRMTTNEPWYLVQEIGATIFSTYSKSRLLSDELLTKKLLITDHTIY